MTNSDLSRSYDRESDLLMQEVGHASGAAQSAWIVLLALEAYFFVALAGISHRDLLLNTPVTQPILQVSVPLRTFILFGPLVLIAVHAAVLQQHAVLIRKLRALDGLLQVDEDTDRSSPARLRVHGYYLAQVEAGPVPGAFLGLTFRLMDWVFLRLLPIALVLAFQITYLPAHDVGVTTWHRVMVIADLLLVIAASLQMRATSEVGAWTALRRALVDVLGAIAAIGVAIFSIAVATVPGEWIDRTLARVEAVSSPVPYQGLGDIRRNRPAVLTGRRTFLPTAYLFEGEVDDWSRSAASLFSRNLIVIDEDLVPDGGDSAERSFSLRGRDLNYATFDRSDMHRADFTDASLIGASLVETNLEKARLVRVRMQGADLLLARLAGIEAEAMLLEGARICEGETPLPMDLATGIERRKCPERRR